MPMPLTGLFQSMHAPRSRGWNEQVFLCAYGHARGPLRQVVDRLQAGQSVLLYLHGSSMRAAAEAVVASTGGTWQQHGLPSNDLRAVDQIWTAHAGLLDALLAQAVGSPAPKVILHNLDMLADGSQGINHNLQAKTALLYLAECTRCGVVLGLSDLGAGDLPDAIRRHFDEEVHLDAIPFDRFAALIPSALGKRLVDPQATELGDQATFLLASRLRWIEPGHAVLMMSEVAAMHFDNLRDTLDEVTRLARSGDFVLPDAPGAAAHPDALDCPGYEAATIEELRRFVIAPFQRWLELDSGDARQALRRLPQGLTLWGPPGTGKSRLARWLATAIGVPVRQVSAADLKRADWGLTERLVRELFHSARRAAPCMIVLDDADDLLPDRASAQGGTASAERGVVNAFLQEIEGFSSPVEGVLVVLTTNRLDSLDKAARSRLPLEFRIPYPLTLGQVAEIVLTLAAEFGALPPEGSWPAPLLDAVTRYFFGPRLDHHPCLSGTDPSDPAQRRRLDDALFSPRDIATAMRMLCATGVPDQGHLAYVRRYYDGRRDPLAPAPSAHPTEP